MKTMRVGIVALLHESNTFIALSNPTTGGSEGSFQLTVFLGP